MYTYEYKQSPNYTPGAQTKAFYGRPRTIELGAGHWWGDPNAGYGHDGVVNGFLNSARQVTAHLVISAGRVTQLVNFNDTAWCTSAANPYTIAIELDPRAYLGGQLAEDIKNTCAEAIAKLIMPSYGNLEWRSHKALVGGTECNPLDWADIRARAVAIVNGGNKPEWQKNLGQIADVTLYAIDDNTPLRNLGNPAEVIKNFGKDTPFEIKGRTIVNGNAYLLTRYAFDNGTGQGFDEYELRAAQPAPPAVPEWQQNLRDITPVKLMVLPAQTPIVNLNDLSVIKQLGQGTYVDFTKSTTVGGKEYLISSYSATNGMPNGMLRADMGVPAAPPINEKPEWLANWSDIADVTMYTRADAALVNLLDGNTIKTIPRATAVEIASATEWHGQKYLITKYSTDKQQAQGIAVADLDMKNPDDKPPVEPAPEQPPIVTLPEWESHDAAMAAPRALRAKVDVNIVDLTTGKPVGTPIKAGTDVEFERTTQYNGVLYLRSKWAVANKKWYAVPVVAFDEIPATPAEPTKPTDSERISVLEAFVDKIKELLAKLGIKL
jgi:hypothetical protein